MNHNFDIFIQDNAFENGVYKLAAILSRGDELMRRHEFPIMSIWEKNDHMWDTVLKTIGLSDSTDDRFTFHVANT